MKPDIKPLLPFLKDQFRRRFIPALAGALFLILGSSVKLVASPIGEPVVKDIPPYTVTITIIKNRALADGNKQDIVKVHVTPLPAGGIVTFSSNGLFPNIPVDANGDAYLALSNSVAGNQTVQVFIEGVLYGSVDVTFISQADPPNLNPGGPSYIQPNFSGSIANYSDQNSVLAHLVDPNGNPVANQTVTFTIASGVADFVGGVFTATTNSNGDAIISLISKVAGDVTLTATVPSGPIVNGSPATVTFVAGPPDVSRPETALIVDVPSTAADGVSTDKVHAHLVDKYGNIAKNQTVTLNFSVWPGGTANANAVLNGGGTVTTDNNGDIYLTITDITTGTVMIGATVNGNTISNSAVMVKFVTSTPDPGVPGDPGNPGGGNPGGANGGDHTQLTITKDKAIADGLDNDQVNAHITDNKGNPVGAGVMVTFFITTGGTIASGAPQLQTNVQTITLPTDASGNITVNITSLKAGTVNIGASILFNGAATPIFGSPQLVTFLAGPPVPVDPSDPDNGTLLTVTKDKSLADGTEVDKVNAHITDINGNPVKNTLVTFNIITGGTITPGVPQLQGNVQTISLLTDDFGNIETSITSTLGGTVMIEATIMYLSLETPIYKSPQPVTFVNLPDVTNPQTALIVLVYEALADGQRWTSVKAHIVDGAGNVMDGQEVIFTIDSGNAQIITPGPWKTDANGDVTIFLTSKTPGNVLVTATVGGKSIVYGSPARMKFDAINIYVPPVFTPNGDGTNDVLKPILVGIAEFHYFSIYNRWGNLIFTTQDANAGWDGKFKGVAQPVETYLWIAEGIDIQGKKIVQKGMTSLVR
ncbi:Ig-like domain-containing protein [Flavitalea flava]